MNTRLSSFVNLVNKNKKSLILLLVATAGIPVGVFLTQQITRLITPAAIDEVSISFQPSSINLSSDTNVDIWVAASAFEVGFVRTTFTFDPAKVQLKSEITTNSNLNTIVAKTSMIQANSGGKVTLVLASPPGGTAPSSDFKLASFTLGASASNFATTTLDLSATDVQVVSTQGNNLLANTIDAAITIGTPPTESIPGTSYYVATTGSDANPGTSLNSPFASLEKALATVKAGDAVFVRGGTYTLTSSITVTGKGGSPQAPIKILAYQNETPIIDGTNAKDDKWALITMRDASYWQFKGLVIKNAKGSAATNNTKRGMQFVGTSSWNTLEDMEFSNNEGTGLHFEDSASNNKIIRAKSHHNYDAANGGTNSDGFAVKNESTAANNEFVACQAYYNSDDGFDLFNGGKTTIRASISYRNGYNDSLQQLGDGNGFKLGKGPGGHTLIQNVAWGNKWKGFDHNNAEGPLYLYNNTAHNNAVDYNFEQTNTGLSVAHQLKNNIGFGSSTKMNPNVVQENNSWNFPWESNPGFISNNNSSSDYLALSSSSPALNAGVNLNLAGFANPPDVGALQEGQKLADLAALGGSAIIVPTNTPEITSLVLVNAQTDTDIMTITNNQTWDLAALPTTNLNVVAKTTANTESVLFGYDGNSNFRLENTAPYTMAGDNSGDYNNWTPTVGTHTITATPYSANDAGGQQGASVSYAVNVINNQSQPTPTPQSASITIKIAATTPDVVDENWYQENFSSDFASPPVVITSMQTYDGGDTSGVRMRNLTANSAEFLVEEEQSYDSEVAHTSEVVGYVAANSDFIYDASGNIIGEAGNTTSIQPGPSSLNNQKTKHVFTNPVVFAQLASYNESDPAHMRIAYTFPDGFSYKIEEWSYLDGTHAQETISYIVLEEGIHTLPDGKVLEVGKTTTDTNWKTVSLSSNFAQTPVVITRGQTVNQTGQIVTRQRSISKTSFQVKLQEEQAQGEHAIETVGYCAIY